MSFINLALDSKSLSIAISLSIEGGNLKCPHHITVLALDEIGYVMTSNANYGLD